MHEYPREFKVIKRLSDRISIIQKHTDAGVATIAQHATHYTGRVAVVYMPIILSFKTSATNITIVFTK
jgi:hypothetical protein